MGKGLGLGLGHMFNSLKTSLHLPCSGLALHSWQLVGCFPWEYRGYCSLVLNMYKIMCFSLQDNRLRKGDQLIAVDNQPIVGLTHAEVNNKL